MDDPCRCGEVRPDIPVEDGLVMGDPVAEALIEPPGKQLMPESKAEASHYVVYPRGAANRLLQLGTGAVPAMDLR